MGKALEQAQMAIKLDEVPVGAVLVKNNQLIGSGYNQMISNNDPTAHAEIQAIRQAGDAEKNYRIIDSTLYVTLEPCMMCVGAIIHARVKRLVFGAYDPKTGMVETADCCFEKGYHNHKVTTDGGVLESECSQLLSNFFKHKRSKKKAK
jgi:tRNA(adenine34) deaminase